MNRRMTSCHPARAAAASQMMRIARPTAGRVSQKSAGTGHRGTPGNAGPIFQISGTGIGVAGGYASSQMRTIARALRLLSGMSASVFTVLLTEAQMHFGSALLAIWLVIGGIAAAQRGDYTDHIDCSSAGTIGVTILAGPLNYAGVDPHIHCSTPQPSN